ncbi:MAG: transposase family protein, partial [Planctomycetes bacterium]|nr:transposase family protein [Planctomycetota bacterium]
KIHRIYKEENLVTRRKRQRIRVVGSGVALAAPNTKNAIWALDFMSDSFESGRKFRILNVLDEGTRQGLLMYCNTSIRAISVVREVERIGRKIGFPKHVRVDNGPEFRSRLFQSWASYRDIEIIYIDPGEPAQNAFIESFNARVRMECLTLYSWPNLAYADAVIQTWRNHYNSDRPHSSLNDWTPDEFAARLAPLRSPVGFAPLAAPPSAPTSPVIVTISSLSLSQV